MSLKDEYKVGQRVWYKYFVSHDGPCAGGSPEEYVITKITDQTLNLTSADIRYNNKWTVNSCIIKQRVWKSLSDFYHEQSFYFRAQADKYKDMADETDIKLAAEMLKGVTQNHDTE